MTGHDFFSEAETRLAKNDKDEQARFVVDLWNASKNLHVKNMALRGELQAMTLRNADLSHSNDLLLSRSTAKLSSDTPCRSAEAFVATAFSEPSDADYKMRLQ